MSPECSVLMISEVGVSIVIGSSSAPLNVGCETLLRASQGLRCRVSHELSISSLVCRDFHSNLVSIPPHIALSLYQYDPSRLGTPKMATTQSTGMHDSAHSVRTTGSSLCLGEEDRQYLEALKDRDHVVTKHTRDPLGLFSVIAFILQQVIGT
jgi:hypothetical protein